MKPLSSKILSFGVASAVTALTWAIFWPRPISIAASPKPPVAALAPVTLSKERIASMIAAVENANSDEAKLNAITELIQIPVTDMREVLEQAKLKDRDRLSLVAKILLIRWAADDGEAATLWAWKRFRSEKSWDQAFREIGPAWAAHNPASLGRWALSAAENRKPNAKEPDMAEIKAMEFPWVDFHMLTEISNWLVTEDPRIAYQLLRKRGGYSSNDPKMSFALTSTAKIQEALEAFDGMRINDPTKFRGDEIHLYCLLKRWHELDPDDFNRSSYTGSIITTPPEVSAGQ